MDRLINELIDFLKSNNALESFIYNLKHRTIKVRGCRNKFIISYAFEWKETEEGFSFWRTLDNKWMIGNYYDRDVLFSELLKGIETKLEIEKELWTD